MSIFLIAVGIIIGIIVIGAILAFVVARFDRAVEENKVELEKDGQGYNPALTLGYAIKVSADPEEQVKEARRLAAQQAAALPRGGNMGIGRLGQPSDLRTAYQGAKQDPWTAAKIAVVHGWDGVRLGPGAATAVAAAPTAAQAAAAPAESGEIELVPGKDYPVIEITDDMSPADIRKARIANAKAKSQAMKAAKAAGTPAAAPATPAAAAPVAVAAPAPAAVGIPEPNYIEITDSMSPDEVRKARIQNSKERSKYNKALKAAGIDPGAADAPTTPAPAASAPEAAPAPASAAVGGADSAALAGIPKPDYIEITDDMSPDEIRKARINNSKERSKYNKALKAAGIDPATVE